MLKNLYLICGKSGSGKTYVANRLSNEYGYKILKSYSTRQPRNKYDDDHIYSNVSEYYDFKDANKIAAWSKYDHTFYWATYNQVNSSDLYIIDKHGIETLRESHPKRPCVVIYIDTSYENRTNNMCLRGDHKSQIKRRLENDEDLFEGIEHYADFIVDGNDMHKWHVIADIIKKCEEVSNGISR